MEEQVLESVERSRGEEPLMEEMRRALADLVDAGVDVGLLTLDAAERKLERAIRVSERVRDDVLGGEAQARARRREDVVGRLRQDGHRIVDVVADFGIYLLEMGEGQKKQDTALTANVRVVEGIGEAYAARLGKAGIYRCEQLLEAGADRRGREALARETDISSSRLLTWVNHVDLFRIRGVGEEYASLLEKAGVDSVPELAQRNPASLYARLQEVNETTAEVRRLPSTNQVADWIRQAKALPRVVTH